MKKIIFRVDDRLIHGQVIEGWIKHFKIPHVIVANDRVAGDNLQKMIFESILPQGSRLSVFTLSGFAEWFRRAPTGKQYVLVIFESIEDLYSVRDLIDEKTYVNIGCVACREHKISISDTVFLNRDELNLLSEIRTDHPVYVHKLPWEPFIEIRNVISLLEDDT